MKKLVILLVVVALFMVLLLGIHSQQAYEVKATVEYLMRFPEPTRSYISMNTRREDFRCIHFHNLEELIVDIYVNLYQVQYFRSQVGTVVSHTDSFCFNASKGDLVKVVFQSNSLTNNKTYAFVVQ